MFAVHGEKRYLEIYLLYGTSFPLELFSCVLCVKCSHCVLCVVYNEIASCFI